jgi:hypothetical protein
MWLWIASLSLICIGILSLVSGGAYYAYSANAKSKLSQLNTVVHITEPATLTNSNPGIQTVYTDSPKQEILPKRVTVDDILSQRLGIGDSLSAQSWADPIRYQPLDYTASRLLEGFTQVTSTESYPVGSQFPATKMILPHLGIDASVSELFIANTSNGIEYQIPTSNQIGHLPATANPGESGSAWYFGHLESPIAGEGSVFSNLPKISEMIRDVKEVFIITSNDRSEFLYRITSTTVVHADELTIHDSGHATIHLVTCVPRLVYNHRLVATGALVGYR